MNFQFDMYLKNNKLKNLENTFVINDEIEIWPRMIEPLYDFLFNKQNMMPKAKSLDEYAGLLASDKRLVNKLIAVLSSKQLDSNAWYTINRIINRSKRVESAKGKKKYTNGWLVFYRERYPQVRVKHKDMEVTGIAKLISSEWKSLSVEEKEKYKKLAAKLR